MSCSKLTWKISNLSTNDIKLLSSNRGTEGLVWIDVDVFNLAITLAQSRKVGYQRMVIATSSYLKDLAHIGVFYHPYIRWAHKIPHKTQFT